MHALSAAHVATQVYKASEKDQVYVQSSLILSSKVATANIRWMPICLAAIFGSELWNILKNWNLII
jgi:hypothetical protein